MDRRGFMKAASAGAVTGMLAMGSNVFAAEHNHAQHMAGSAPKRKRRALGKAQASLVQVTNKCVMNAEACLARCMETTLSGDTSMADCQATVMDMIAMCNALKQVAVNNTADEAKIKSLAKLCADYCRECEKECKPHATHHAECKACLESCGECIKACDAFVA